MTTKQVEELMTRFDQIIENDSVLKKKIVALTALMRKIIVIANARIRDLNLSYS